MKLEEIKEYRNVPTKIAAKLLNVSEQFIRIGLQKNRLPFGTAVQITENGKWTYQISPGLLEEYITGESIKEYFKEKIKLEEIND